MSDVIVGRLVEELNIAPRQIEAVAALLAEGATIPFIARYRKEAHGNLDEVQISKIQERLAYHRELEDRREVILKSIDSQGKLSDELKAKVLGCLTKTALEDLYLPYKPKRRTRAMIAKENGLEPLATSLLEHCVDPEGEAAKFIGEKVADVTAALQGARDIVAELIAEDADIRGFARSTLASRGMLASKVVEPAPTEPTKFEQYYEFSEALASIPSHRFLAIRRGQNEGVLHVRLSVEPEPVLGAIKKKYGSSTQVDLAAADAYRRLIAPGVEVDVLVELKMRSDRSAVEVFAENLRHLLLQAPLGEQAVIGVDPGLRTGCKVAALDATGKFLENKTIFPSQGAHKMIEAQVEVCKLLAKYKPTAIAVGNGTGGRETEAFLRETLTKSNHQGETIVVSVNEAGASVYSASEVAREEFADLDLTVRGAISIGRRLQDPLAELVKIDPKAIGVGQYQHDVNQTLLADKLNEVVVSCVNHVGVELNTASAPLLTRVSGIGESMAKKIVSYRDEHGAFGSRKQLLKVPSLGPKCFEQAAGFLRIHGAKHPLDASAVHPERYALVEQMAADVGIALKDLIGNTAAVDKIRIANYVSAEVGDLTLKDIIAELKKPGRDPRATFEKPAFRDDITEIAHVKEGMALEGIVTNVTAFGAFVDIGVHQDGLIHVSELSDRYVSDPSQVVKAGDRIKVRVLSVDLPRKRISLSAKTAPSSGSGGGGRPSSGGHGGGHHGGGNRPPQGGNRPPPRAQFNNNPFAGL